MTTLSSTMKHTSGTVFLFCDGRDTESISAFAQAAEQAGRQFYPFADVQALDPAVLAGQSGRSAIQVRPSMLDFVDRYLEACPAGQAHRLLCAPGYDRTPNMSMIFHDFWEERKVAMETFGEA